MSIDQIVDKLNLCWLNGTKGLSSPQSIKDDVFCLIIDEFKSSSRCYHNLYHLYHIFFELEKASVNSEVCFWAVWFHDFVQKQFSSKNEIESALIAQKYMNNLSVNVATQREVYRLILATKAHEKQSQYHLNAFLDADMAILGSSQHAYDLYVKSIYREYWLLPSVLVRNGRHKFLKLLISQPRIFHTDHFHDLYETQSRINITRELNNIY